ncbi:hypothetical protein RIR_jg42154.t1 [Rhizophagus irregularis DAOM 181602=DAOM 197198]|nr:hypothetical protein RIR_jg42154.t1 [Rhizophagus irregularis DAOM 181602=DAOM 197198]
MQAITIRKNEGYSYNQAGSVIEKLMDLTTLFPIFLLRNLKQSISISLYTQRNNFLYYVIAMYSQIYFILFICKPSSGNNLFHK